MGTDQHGRQTGVIAQEVEKVFPEWIGVEPSDGMKTVEVNPRQMLGLTVEAFRTLKTENDDLRERVKSLEDGRRPMMSGFGEGWIGVGLLGVAGALLISGRKRSEKRA